MKIVQEELNKFIEFIMLAVINITKFKSTNNVSTPTGTCSSFFRLTERERKCWHLARYKRRGEQIFFHGL